MIDAGSKFEMVLSEDTWPICWYIAENMKMKKSSDIWND